MMSIVDYCCYALFDFVLYLVIDVKAKRYILQAKNWQERRDIWLKEAVGLVVLSVFISLHHTPYMLFCIIVITIVYAFSRSTALFNKLIRFVEYHFETWWNYDASLHEQRNREISALRQENFTPSSSWRLPVPSGYEGSNASTNSNAELAEQRNDSIPLLNVPSVDSGAVLSTYPSSSATLPGNIYGVNVIQRRSLRPITPVQRSFERMIMVNNDPCFRNVSAGNSSHSISQKFHSVANSLFGKSNHSCPAGLKNTNQNVCFVNATLQAFAHTPYLSDILLEAEKTIGNKKSTGECNENVVQFFEKLLEIVLLLSKPRDEAVVSVIDAEKFREAASLLDCQTLKQTSSEGNQLQQDTAEFFQWLLMTLHELLTVSNAVRPTEREVLQSRLPFSLTNALCAVSSLNDQYSYVNTSTVNDWKAELEQAHSIDPSVYGEVLAHLANVSWLTYKLTSGNSPISDLFAGQLISVQQCLECGRLRADFQPFTVLTLSVAKPRLQTGLVSLQDCLEFNIRVQQMTGENKLFCEHCNRHGNKTQSSAQLLKDGAMPYSSTPLGGIANGSARQKFKQHNPNVSPIARDGLTSVYEPLRPMDSLLITPLPSANKKTASLTSKLPRTLQNGQKRFMLHNMPANLIMQLMRFEWNQASFRKITRPVTFPLRLSMRPYCLEGLSCGQFADVTDAVSGASPTYELYAFIIHKGGEEANGGHYVAYAVSDDHRWHMYDDEIVKEVSIEYEISTLVVRSNIYMLCYRRLT